MDFTLTLIGTEPLLMHNARLVDPLDPIVKAKKKVTAKTKKTDDDHEEIARLEFAGSLYIDDQLGPFLPGQNIERSLLDAARTTKRGKAIERGVFITSNVNPLIYSGPRTIDTLWADENYRHMASVKQQMNRIMRCRPQFRSWEVEATGRFDPNIIDPDVLADIATTAGQIIGIGDWRPRYGRYIAKLEVSK